jgi:hypothetical protein
MADKGPGAEVAGRRDVEVLGEVAGECVLRRVLVAGAAIIDPLCFSVTADTSG